MTETKSEAQPQVLRKRTQLPYAKARFVVLVTTLCALALVALAAHCSGWLTAEGIQHFVERGGIYSPLLYLVVASLLIVAWFPRGLLSMVAGALFGVAMGSLLALLMGTIGALGGYTLGIKLGHPYVAQQAKKRSLRIIKFIQRRGFWAVLACRVCPLVPTELISVTSGTTKIPLCHFIGASLLGMAPTAGLYAAFGASLLDPNSRWITWVSLATFLALTLVTLGFLVALWRRDRQSVAAQHRC